MASSQPIASYYLRQGRRPVPLPQPPPFPTPDQAQNTPPALLPALIQSLALASSYSLAAPSTRTLLKLACYSFALGPTAPKALFFGDIPPGPVTDTWSLAKVQGERQPVGSTIGEYSESRRGKVCGRVFKAGESVYRCRDCALDSTCVLCSKCFHGSAHSREGHDVTLSIHSGIGAGCCDCGDAEAFKEGRHTDCKYHSSSATPSEGDVTPPVESDEALEALKSQVAELLRVLVDWMLLVLDDSPDEMIPPKSVEDIIAAIPRRPPPPPFAPPPPLAESSSSFGFSSPPSYSSSTSRGKARAASPSDDSSTPAGPWSVVLWNDEKHSFTQVIDQVSRATGISQRDAAAVAQRVDTHGRDVVYISPDPTQLVMVSRLIAEIDLAVTVRSSLDTFYEQVAGELVVFFKDLAAAQVGGQDGVLSEVLAKVLLERPDSLRSRFQKLVCADSKLWKEARKGLAEVYVTLLGVNPAIKRELSVHFAQVYASVGDAYLLTDREPENSIIFFGVQVFTVPSIATYIVQNHQFLAGMISMLYSFFTDQRDPTDRKRLYLPPNPTLHRIDPESSAFKQKRYFQIFSDLNHLIASPGVKRFICSSSSIIDDLAAFLDLFTSMNPNQRAVSTHVEYESDTWVTAFNVTIQLGKICRAFGEAFRVAEPFELARALSKLLARLPGPRAGIQTLVFGGNTYQLIDFRVDSFPVSFHHPLAWLFAEMVKNVEALDTASLQRMNVPGVTTLSEIILGRAGQLHFLAAMDHPLRVIVLVAQIRAGLWVRNGFGMRAQQLHYKEYSLRENTYDQDVFFLQTALVVLDPSLIFIAIMERFQVHEWLGGNDNHPVYDAGQAITMVEEMIYLLIVLLSDATYANGIPSDLCLRRELIHNLCLGPSLYSDLMRRVSERFADDPALDRILGEVAHFKQPVGTSDQGTYTLRHECYAEVNPYFSRFSRNQREEADKIVREHLKKTTGEKDPVIVPPTLGITRGPFVTLSAAFNSDVLHQIIYFSLKHGLSRGELFSEVLVDETLHLIMLVLVEQPTLFAPFAAERILSSEEDEATLVRLLVKVENDERMKTVRHKVRWCLDRLGELIGPSVQALRKIEDTAPAAKALDAKRLAAKARQEAIMKQFAQAQQSFLESSENIDNEDEDEMEGEEPRVSLGSCIVCQDELDGSTPFGLLALIQGSNFIRITPTDKNADFQQEVLATPSSLDQDASSIRPFGIASKKKPVNLDDESGDGVSDGYPQMNQSGLHASACGHMMHLACFETYRKSLEQRHHLQPTRCHPENTDRQEFVCPLCKSLGNVLLPATVDVFAHPADQRDARDLDEWSQSVIDRLGRAVSIGVLVDKVDDFVGQVRRLDRRVPGGKSGLAAWELGSSLPLRKPSEFADGDRLMVARLLNVTFPLMQELGAGVSFLPSELLAYSISAVEVASRGTAEPAATCPEATTRMLQSLLTILRSLVEVQTGSARHAQLAAFAVTPHIGGIFALDKRTKDLFKMEPLATIVEAAAVMPESFHQVVAFCFYTELVKVFFGVSHLLEGSEDVVAYQGDAADEAVADYLALARARYQFVAADANGLNGPEAELTLGKHLYSYMLPFLRRASIVHGVLYDGAPPVQGAPVTGSEFSRLVHALGIPHPALVLSSGVVFPGSSAILAHIQACCDAIPGWFANVSADGTRLLPPSIPQAALNSATELQHPAIYELVGLPAQLATLAAECLQRECDRCHLIPAEPALCLLCGQVVCQQSFCCMDGEDEAQHGECNMHMWTCGGTVGIYFLVKRNSVLYLYTDRGAFSSPPYLDSHGEVDLGGRRGRNQFPQFLHHGRYDEIRKAWLNHGIPTFVARKLEATTDHGGWETF